MQTKSETWRNALVSKFTLTLGGVLKLSDQIEQTHRLSERVRLH